jgi:hypothetical protein
MEKITELEQLRYPIGRYIRPAVIDASHISTWIGEIAAFPQRLKEQIAGIGEKELEWRMDHQATDPSLCGQSHECIHEAQAEFNGRCTYR